MIILVTLGTHRDHQFVRHGVVRPKLRLQSLYCLQIPARVNDPQLTKVKPQWNGLEPSYEFFVPD